MEFTPVFFSGGLKCIDFCNTFDHFNVPPAYDLFPDREAMIGWGRAAGLLPADFQEDGKGGDESTARALEARAIIYRLLSAFSRMEAPGQEELARFNALLQEVSGRMEIGPGEQGYALVCRAEDALERVVCEVVRSAADLLLSNQLERVKQCEECGWLLYDATRNGSRRWCEMKSCGNRAKARRHYERVRQGRGEGARMGDGQGEDGK